jgi:hypothetical protein
MLEKRGSLAYTGTPTHNHGGQLLPHQVILCDVCQTMVSLEHQSLHTASSQTDCLVHIMFILDNPVWLYTTTGRDDHLGFCMPDSDGQLLSSKPTKHNRMSCSKSDYQLWLSLPRALWSCTPATWPPCPCPSPSWTTTLPPCPTLYPILMCSGLIYVALSQQHLDKVNLKL